MQQINIIVGQRENIHRWVIRFERSVTWPRFCLAIGQILAKIYVIIVDYGISGPYMYKLSLFVDQHFMHTNIHGIVEAFFHNVHMIKKNSWNTVFENLCINQDILTTDMSDRSIIYIEQIDPKK